MKAPPGAWKLGLKSGPQCAHLLACLWQLSGVTSAREGTTGGNLALVLTRLFACSLARSPALVQLDSVVVLGLSWAPKTRRKFDTWVLCLESFQFRRFDDLVARLGITFDWTCAHLSRVARRRGRASFNTSLGRPLGICHFWVRPEASSTRAGLILETWRRCLIFGLLESETTESDRLTVAQQWPPFSPRESAAFCVGQ